MFPNPTARACIARVGLFAILRTQRLGPRGGPQLRQPGCREARMACTTTCRRGASRKKVDGDILPSTDTGSAPSRARNFCYVVPRPSNSTRPIWWRASRHRTRHWGRCNGAGRTHTRPGSFERALIPRRGPSPRIDDAGSRLAGDEIPGSRDIRDTDLRRASLAANARGGHREAAGRRQPG